MMGKWYQKDVKQVEELLQVKVNKGLSERQVTERRKRFGSNILQTEKNNPNGSYFYDNFKILWFLFY